MNELICKLLGHRYEFTWFRAAYDTKYCVAGFKLYHCTRCNKNLHDHQPNLPHYIPGEKTLSHGDTTNV